MAPLMNRFLLRALPLPFLSLGGALHAQLTVDNSQGPITLVNDILVGQGVAVSNVTFNGVALVTPNEQIGSFNGVDSNIGLSGGIAICTGDVMLLPGPNLLGGATASPASPNETPDPDLAMFTGTSQHCVAALEFDFIPTGDSIRFRFVFGSEEYPEYVCTNFNDAFGFFLSGPGINGPFTHQAINLARVPGTSVPVAINTVNPGVPGSNNGNASTCAASDPNWQANSIYYVDNPEPDPFFNPTTTVELDGFTVPLTAHAAVQCGQTYHIKMVIANGMDGTLDSAVLIEGGSFSSASSLVASVTTPQGDGTLTEGCGNAVVTLTRSNTHGDAAVVLASAGSGITSGDVTPAIPATVTIPDGSSSVSFPVGAVRDNTAEGAEALTIAAAWASNCGTVLHDTVTITLLDYTPIAIDAHDLYLHCDQDSVLLDAQAAGGLGQLQLHWEGNTTGGPIHAPGLVNGTYTVAVTDECPETRTLDVHVFSGCEITVPNVFTPNGDGANDTWVISGIQRGRHSVRVFNRWGQVVFESTNYANNWRAAGLSDGTYFYEVISDGADEPLVGSLTILSNGRR